jgi:hypothetical protein
MYCSIDEIKLTSQFVGLEGSSGGLFLLLNVTVNWYPQYPFAFDIKQGQCLWSKGKSNDATGTFVAAEAEGD